MPPRHEPHAAPRSQGWEGPADRVAMALPTQKARCGNTGPFLQVGHSPIRGSYANRKGVTVVRHHSAGRPLVTHSTLRVSAAGAA
jgi:hypothetical protein